MIWWFWYRFVVILLGFFGWFWYGFVVIWWVDLVGAAMVGWWVWVVVVLLMMVVASGDVVLNWQVAGWLGLKCGCVGFWVYSRWWERGWDREGEAERQKWERERERGFWVIYFIVYIYYFNVLHRKIKIEMLGML